MDVTAIIYDLKQTKGKTKTYLIRKVFGYTDKSNHCKYTYQRPGLISNYIYEKWGRSVIITKHEDTTHAQEILKRNKIPYQTRKIKILD